MKQLNYALGALLILTACNNQCTEFYLTRIQNNTPHTITWEKLPLPGMLGKMKPVIIKKSESIKPNMPLIPPVILSFKNPKNQVFLMDMTLRRRVLKGGPDFRKDPKKYEFTELTILLTRSDGSRLRIWSEQVKPTFAYEFTIDLKGKNLKKTDVVIIGHEIPIANQ